MRRTALGIDVQTGEKIWVKDKTRCSGMYILGKPGHGKSLLLLNLIYQDAEKGYAIIVFDLHDDLINHVIAILPEERLKKTYILDLNDIEYPIGLNLFACSNPADDIERAVVVERVMHIFEKLWPDMKGVLYQIRLGTYQMQWCDLLIPLSESTLFKRI